MTRVFLADSLPSSAGRNQVQYPGGWNIQAICPAGMASYPAEGAAAGAAALVTLQEPVRTLGVTAVVAVYVAKTLAALATPATGLASDRVFVAAGQTIDLPWYQDEIHFKAAAGAGAVFFRGTV